ncbi:unnamed protein product [Trichogramma brassicae]|uniref:Uncharacterized protein n=1 Tax=Trichogramma brassicae TaxID=86971 RepID=A0A6H5IEY4_9HYME|nr:unnamed protein product [Trichogramma brassicae]
MFMYVLHVLKFCISKCKKIVNYKCKLLYHDTTSLIYQIYDTDIYRVRQKYGYTWKFRGIKHLPVSTIFAMPVAEDGRLSAAPILLPDRYRLLRRCWFFREQHRLSNIIVRNIRIYMRYPNCTKLTLINTEADLNALAIALPMLSRSFTSSRHPLPTSAS